MRKERIFIVSMASAPMPAVGFSGVAVQEAMHDCRLWNADPTLLDEHLHTSATFAKKCWSAISAITATLTIALAQVGIDVVGVANG